MAFHQAVSNVFDRDQFGGFLDMIVKQLTSLEYDLFGSEEAHQTLENVPQVEKISYLVLT